MGFLDALRERSRRRRARREARALVRETRSVLRRFSYRIPEEVRQDLGQSADELDRARRSGDHDAICSGLTRLDDQVDRHLSFARKSTLREYAESIGVAVLIALFLRAFVVEAFKIPSGSMIPTMEVGDHIFVNKFIYGIRIPFTKIKFFDYRKPRRGEVIVFIYPKEPDKDFIKRIVGVEGDRIRVRDDEVYLNGHRIPRRELEGPCGYWDYEEGDARWRQHNGCKRFEETLGDETYLTISELGGTRDYPSQPEGCAKAECKKYGNCMEPDPNDPTVCVVPKGHVFVLGDNRNNSHDSRFWGAVPFENIKGKAMIIWWSSGEPEGIRWRRLGKIVD